ncbi:MAG: ASKHA domain-containing protein [Firmicutes bacterium]|nr:ASKHA domain-containing protein [Bacillota bacterium]
MDIEITQTSSSADAQARRQISLTVVRAGEKREITAFAGDNLLELLRANDIHISAVCGGNGTCGKCAVVVKNGAIPASKHDTARFSPEELGEGYRLACEATPERDAEIFVRDDSGFDIVSAYSANGFAAAKKRFGLIEFDFGAEKRSLLSGVKSRTGRRAGYGVIKKLSGLINENGGDTYGAGLYGRNPVYLLTDEDDVLDVFAEKPALVCGAAVDIGTTTVAMELYDLLTSEKLASFSMINGQKSFGADVISRIMAAGGGRLGELHRAVADGINEGLKELCKAAGAPRESLVRVMAAGNTTMLHLFMNTPCQSLGKIPFLPTFTETVTLPAGECFFPDFRCKITVLPGVSAYVGSDITAGICFCGGLSDNKAAMLVDLGTNGEMAVYSGRDRILCASTAAGPAFEGGNISQGIGGVPGAVAKAKYKDGAFTVATIGSQKPVGICGSGVLDIAAELVRHGLVDETGLLGDDYFDDGVIVVPGAGAIRFTQKDVREFQLAKSAVRAGIEVLIDEAGLKYEDVGRIYLAGGFGFKIDLDSAGDVGLFPPELRERVAAVGNSSLGGCALALLDAGAQEEIERIAREAAEISLSEDRRFAGLFMEHMTMEKA